MSGPVDAGKASIDDVFHEQELSGNTNDRVPERHDSKNDNKTTAASSSHPSAVRPDDISSAVVQNRTATAQNSTVLPYLQTTVAQPSVTGDSHALHLSPASAGLHLDTDLSARAMPIAARKEPPMIFETPVEDAIRENLASPKFSAIMGSSLRSTLSNSSFGSSFSPSSTSSALPSPYLASLTDLTPLPSPTIGSDGPPTWRRPAPSSRSGSTEEITRLGRASSVSSIPSNISPRKKKAYGHLQSVTSGVANMIATAQENEQAKKSHSRNRSISDFVPDQLQNMRQRHVTFGPGDTANPEYHMHREAHLAVKRGLTSLNVDHLKALPSPPPSNTSIAESDDAEDESLVEDVDPSEYLQIHCGINNRKRRFRQLRLLGQGTFSKVMLATNERVPSNPPPDIELHLDPHRLVAVKMVEHGPAGGADEERIETSLKREVEMLKSISHPSLIRLIACEDQFTRTLLVLTYCPGGDLFDLASGKRDLLKPALVQRIFSELVSAARYLHRNWIVHRDIKLENVLVNLPAEQLREVDNPLTFSAPIVTLSDLGLSRRIPQPPESPLLTTRCGSEDYAAPEILLGQPYDGRLTDGWALGVLLYALIEGRLPFDAPPGKPDRSRNTHRIARCDWIWCKFGDDAGEWAPQRGPEYEGARICVESLLKKVRMGRKPLESIEAMDWVKQGIQVPGGLQVRDEDHDDF